MSNIGDRGIYSRVIVSGNGDETAVSPHSISIVDGDTGKTIDNVTKIDISMEIDSIPRFIITTSDEYGFNSKVYKYLMSELHIVGRRES